MSQFNGRNYGDSQESRPPNGESTSFITSFSSGEPPGLASPLLAYSPNNLHQRERFNSSNHLALDFLPPPRNPSPDAIFLSPSQNATFPGTYSHEGLSYNSVPASPSSSGYPSAQLPLPGQPGDFPPTQYSPSLGLGITGTSAQETLLYQYQGHNIAPAYFQSDLESRRPSPHNENEFHYHTFDSAEKPARKSEEQYSRNQESLPRNERLSLMPPPEPIEVPTAEDVRFGIKGAKSAGWDEVRRQSRLMNTSDASKQGWRQSFFSKYMDNGNDGSKLAYLRGTENTLPNRNDDLYGISHNNDSSLSIAVEDHCHGQTKGFNSNIKTEFGQQKPFPSFMRPISMACDDSFTTIRGISADRKPAGLRIFSPGVHSPSLGSPRAGSSSNHGSHLGNQEDYSFDRDEKGLEYLPHDFNLFDFVGAEADDALHDPGPLPPRKGADRVIVESKSIHGKTDWSSSRGWLNASGLVFLVLALVFLFAGFPIIEYFSKRSPETLGGFNLGGINATGQFPAILGFRGLIDADTPKSARTKKGVDGKAYQLVFSDEFNQPGRTFWPGDDPYWEAVDLHYWATKNLEWYDPDQVTTKNGTLVITLDKVANPSLNHNLDFRGGMLQSWNKFCFTGGIIEASISLSGDPAYGGMWPAFWTMGNLGRAGYGATLDGTWPYSYDSCDVGTLPNQTDPKTGGPAAALTMGDPYNHNELSFLPGQRLSRCTCPKNSATNSHPGPKHSDGTWVGRSAPEIDVLEGITDAVAKMGQVSQSLQLAPYNAHYNLNNLTAGNVKIYNNQFKTELNPYTGNVYQQAASGLSYTDQTAYEGRNFASYGFEYAPSDSAQPFITWTQKDQAMWQLTPGAIGPDPLTQISSRTISNEPMYILLNLGISSTFGVIDLEKISFPAQMKVDWVRVYQPVGTKINTNCSPPNYPTAEYISDHIEAYTNPNLTTWKQYQESRKDNTGNSKTGFPKNKLLDVC